MTLVLGVDACPGGWVGVELHDGRFAAAHFDRELRGLVKSTPDAAAIAVDIPLGLADEDWRDADAAAKKFLGKRSSSVFMTPPNLELAERRMHWALPVAGSSPARASASRHGV